VINIRDNMTHNRFSLDFDIVEPIAQFFDFSGEPADVWEVPPSIFHLPTPDERQQLLAARVASADADYPARSAAQQFTRLQPILSPKGKKTSPFFSLSPTSDTNADAPPVATATAASVRAAMSASSTVSSYAIPTPVPPAPAPAPAITLTASTMASASSLLHSTSSTQTHIHTSKFNDLSMP
jgi:hypothetical protein